MKKMLIIFLIIISAFLIINIGLYLMTPQIFYYKTALDGIVIRGSKPYVDLRHYESSPIIGQADINANGDLSGFLVASWMNSSYNRFLNVQIAVYRNQEMARDQQSLTIADWKNNSIAFQTGANGNFSIEVVEDALGKKGLLKVTMIGPGYGIERFYSEYYFSRNNVRIIINDDGKTSGEDILKIINLI